MPQKNPSSSFLLAASLTASVALSGAACDALTGPDYPGESLLTLKGEVTEALEVEDADDGVQVAIVWVAGNANGALSPVAETTEVEGDFPASFSLDVYHPPEDSALVTFDNGARIGIGFIVALPKDGRTGDQVDLSTMLGVTNQHAVIYIPGDQDLAPAIEANRKFHNGQVGFNLFDVAATSPDYETCKTDAVAAIDSCHDDCTANCDPDSAEDPGCDLCRAPCEELSAGLVACDDLVDAIVSTSTNLELTLDPDAVAASAVVSIFAGAGADSPNE